MHECTLLWLARLILYCDPAVVSAVDTAMQTSEATSSFPCGHHLSGKRKYTDCGIQSLVQQSAKLHILKAD